MARRFLQNHSDAENDQTNILCRRRVLNASNAHLRGQIVTPCVLPCLDNCDQAHVIHHKSDSAEPVDVEQPAMLAHVCRPLLGPSVSSDIAREENCGDKAAAVKLYPGCFCKLVVSVFLRCRLLAIFTKQQDDVPSVTCLDPN